MPHRTHTNHSDRKVGIVIPLYNHENYIGPALDSLYAQSRPAAKIVIIDDGSQDRSVEVARTKANQSVELITQANAGAHATLNRAVAMLADYDYIGILNSDDLYHPERIQRCLEFLERNTDSDVVCTGLKMIDTAGRVRTKNDSSTRWTELVWSTQMGNPIERLGISNFTKTTSNFFGRAEYFIAHPFRAYRYIHDYHFAVICALEHRLAVLPQELLFYRTHQTNTIKSDGADKVVSEVTCMHIDLLRELAPLTATSPQLRSDLADYFRNLLGNHSDFRTEVFLYLLSQLADRSPESQASSLFATVNKTDFPELLASSSRSLREKLAAAEFHELYRSVISSKWMALGRLLGVGGWWVAADQRPHTAQLASFKSSLNASRWLRLGRKLGLGPDLLNPGAGNK